MPASPSQLFQNLQPRSEFALRQALEALEANVPAVISIHIDRGKVDIEYSIVRLSK